MRNFSFFTAFFFSTWKKQVVVMSHASPHTIPVPPTRPLVVRAAAPVALTLTS